MRTIDLTGIGPVPALGQGTWKMGERRQAADVEAHALNTGIDLGMTVIDTAEMYGDGATESFLGQALSGRRDEVTLISKAYPRNASRQRLPKACEASLRRLNTDRIDLYLLHWRGSVPLDETVEAMESLKRLGKIRSWGVSNFDERDTSDLWTAGGTTCAADQILYNLGRRGPEFGLLPALKDKDVALIAYSPIEQGRSFSSDALEGVANRHGASCAQIALAWLLHRGALSIPKAASVGHVHQNRAAADLVLSNDDLAALDRAFPPPSRKEPLEML